MTLITPISDSSFGTSPMWVTLPTMLTFTRRKKVDAFWPMVTRSTSAPLSCHALASPSILRNRLLFRPPARPRSEEITMKPTRLTCSRSTRNRSEEHTSELQSQSNLVCRLLLEKKKKIQDDGAWHQRLC